jgi:hypothetical protein
MDWILTAVSVVFGAGAAWGGATAALNGTRNRVKSIEEWAVQHDKKDDEFQREGIDRLARIETKIDMLRDK